MAAELAHRAEHRDPPRRADLGTETLQGRRHRRRVGVVAFVDQQDIAAIELDGVALAAAFQCAHVAQREARRGDVAADRFDHRQRRQRVGHPMVAALGDGEGQVAVEQ